MCCAAAKYDEAVRVLCQPLFCTLSSSSGPKESNREGYFISSSAIETFLRRSFMEAKC
jgi:hypothetical protein